MRIRAALLQGSTQTALLQAAPHGGRTNPWVFTGRAFRNIMEHRFRLETLSLQRLDRILLETACDFARSNCLAPNLVDVANLQPGAPSSFIAPSSTATTSSVLAPSSDARSP